MTDQFTAALIQPGAAYAGIGARATPNDVLRLMTAIATHLAAAGMVLRSGGAAGADSAFAEGAPIGARQIFAPWPGFCDAPDAIVTPADIAKRADPIAERFHPNWPQLTAGVRKLHIRNVLQILGAKLIHPAAFVICWTPAARGGGGTGQALRIARHYGVPIFDLADVAVRAAFEAALGLSPPPQRQTARLTAMTEEI